MLAAVNTQGDVYFPNSRHSLFACRDHGRHLVGRVASVRLAEIDGKALLRRHGLACPRGILLGAGEDPLEALACHWPGYFLKAQPLEGGRGKRGLVRHFDRLSDFRKARRLILATLDDADTLLLLAIRTNYLQALANDEGTKAVLFCGEIGGDKEYAFAEAARRFSKPIIAMVVGRHAPAQKQMGHAGALIGNWRESAQAKLNALTGAGCHVAMGTL